jgi:hypothetical protein
MIRPVFRLPRFFRIIGALAQGFPAPPVDDSHVLGMRDLEVRDASVGACPSGSGRNGANASARG